MGKNKRDFTDRELRDIASQRGTIIAALQTQIAKLEAELVDVRKKYDEQARSAWKLAAYDQLRSKLTRFVRDEFHQADIWPDDDWDD